VVVPPLVNTIFNFWAAYLSENLPLKYEQLVLLPFGQQSTATPMTHCRRAGLGRSRSCYWWILSGGKVARLQKFFDDFKVFVANRHALPLVTNRPIIPGQSYILPFVHLFLILLWLLLLPMLSKLSDRLTDSYRRYLYHRQMQEVMFLCCRLCWLFVDLKKKKNKPMARQSLREVSQFVD
jgi:hypothetical protein